MELGHPVHAMAAHDGEIGHAHHALLAFLNQRHPAQPIDVTGLADPGELRDRGLAHVPEDRMEAGLVADFTIADNLVLNSYWAEPFSSGMRASR